MDSKMEYDSTDTKIKHLDNECKICFVNEPNKILPCEHTVCESCYQNIELCPFCRNKLNKPIVITITSTNTMTNNDEYTIYDRINRITYYIIISILFSAPVAWLTYGMILFRKK
jgi:hypothetical protein